MPDVKMPQLGESVTEGTVGQWLKQVGDSVAKYEPLLEVVTDKVTAEVPSDFDGILQEVCVTEGDTVSVGTVLCKIATDSVGPPATAPVSDNATTPSADGQTVERLAETQSVTVAGHAGPSTRRHGRFSPAVLNLAEQHNVNLDDVNGSGEGGRITRKDVLAFVEGENRRKDLPAPVESENAAAVQSAVASEGTRTTRQIDSPKQVRMSNEDVEVVEASAIRKMIASRMVESKHNAPHAWTMVEVDVTRLAQFRDRVKKDFKQREGVDLTYLPFFIKAAVEGLKRFPEVNSSWVDGQIHFKKKAHISIAVATDNGLVVPVIHDADSLSIAGLAHRIHELAAKARSGRLAVSDVQGGTFTVNNTGAFGSVLSQPILNAPQAAILSCESVVKRPVVIDDAIAIRSIVNLCMSLDHRVLDGWVAGKFLQAVRERLSSFGPETVLY